MLWARLLTSVTGTVNQELLLRNEYLAAENRILRNQIRGRLLLSDGEKVTLADQWKGSARVAKNSSERRHSRGLYQWLRRRFRGVPRQNVVHLQNE